MKKIEDNIKEISNGRIELVKFNGSFSRSEASVFRDNQVNMLFKRNYVSEYSCLKRDPNASPFNSVIKLNDKLINATSGLIKISNKSISNFGEKKSLKKEILFIDCGICNSTHKIKGDSLRTKTYNLLHGKNVHFCENNHNSLSQKDFAKLAKEK